MRPSWPGSMITALVATLANPSWWLLALAAFLVRGGLILILLPIIVPPSVASLTTTLAPILQVLVLGRQSVEGVILAVAVTAAVLVALAAAGLVGSWLDLALVREAARDEEVELRWRPTDASVQQAFALRLTAHLPTLLAVGYASVRLIGVGYEEFTAPGDGAVPVETRILARAPDTIVLVIVAWLFGETAGALAARRAAAGQPAIRALLAAARQVATRRGLATLGLTTALLAALAVPFILATSRAWEGVRAALLDGPVEIQLAAATLLLVAAWILGLAVLGAGLAWRATAWTAEVAPPVPGGTDVSLVPAEVTADAAAEIARS